MSRIPDMIRKPADAPPVGYLVTGTDPYTGDAYMAFRKSRESANDLRAYLKTAGFSRVKVDSLLIRPGEQQ